MQTIASLKVRKDLMSAAEKEKIKAHIRAVVGKGRKPDPTGIAREFKRLPETIRKLAAEVWKEDHVPTYTELTYESMWGIIGCMMTGMRGEEIIAKYGCTVDDIKQLGIEYSIPWAESLTTRRALMQEYGPNWKEAAERLAQWQP